jgi:hypothetical protein
MTIQLRKLIVIHWNKKMWSEIVILIIRFGDNTYVLIEIKPTLLKYSHY